jgi:hypothetical protein
MNFQTKPSALNVFDKDTDESYKVVELMFTDVIEITGITPVDSVRRIHRLEVFDGYDAYLQYDADLQPTDLA